MSKSNSDDKAKVMVEISGIAAAGAVAGYAVAIATSVALAAPMGIGAGIACIGYGVIRFLKRTK